MQKLGYILQYRPNVHVVFKPNVTTYINSLFLKVINIEYSDIFPWLKSKENQDFHSSGIYIKSQHVPWLN